MKPEAKKRILIVVIAFACGMGAFAGGRKIIKHFKKERAAERGPYIGEQEILNAAFTEEMLPAESQVLPPCKTLNDLAAQVNVLKTDASQFFNAYKDVKVLEARTSGDRFKVTYELRVDRRTIRRDAWAYRRSRDAKADAAAAVLIIPGTGEDQATAIFNGDAKNYHGPIAAVAGRYGDVYVLVKPNEDFLAIHDATHKLNDDFLIIDLLNHGGSYSASYITDSLAIAKYLRGHYKKYAVVGLSQGGEATLLNALQSAPTAAVVASGFTALVEKFEHAGYGQIIIPGLWSHYTNEAIRKRIASEKTQYLFTYGMGEAESYRMEAQEGITQKFLGGLPNVEVVAHTDGHEFPMGLVAEFLKRNLGD